VALRQVRDDKAVAINRTKAFLETYECSPTDKQGWILIKPQPA
jgi:hypothetical protein